MELEEGQRVFAQAREALASGQPAQALPLLQRFLAECQDCWEVRLELARALYLGGKLQEARSELLEIAVEGARPEVWWNLGGVHGALGEYREEAEAYRKAARVCPEVLFNQGLQAASRGEEKALRGAREALLEEEGEGARSSWLGALLAESREDLEAAVEAYRAARRQGAVETELGANLARCLVALGRPREAEEELLRLRSEGPDRWEFCLLEGAARHAQEDVAGARQALERAVSMAPESEPLPSLNLGSLLLEAGDAGAASGYFLRASRAAPEDRETLLLLARARFSAGRFAQAAEDYRRIVEDDPGHFRALYNLAFSLERIEELEEARATYEKALARRPGHYKTMNKLARLQLREGHADRAYQLAEKSLLQEHEDNAEGYLVMAQALKVQGRFSEALVPYEEGLRREPGNASGWKDLAFCQRRQDLFQEAKESAKRAYSLEPRDPEVLLELGFAYLELGSPTDLPKSKRAFQELLERAPGNAKALAGLAQALVLTAPPEEAYKAAKRAVAGKGGYRAYAALGAANLRLRRPEKAIEAFKLCLGRNRGYAPACDGISEAYRDLGDGKREEKYRTLAQKLRSRREEIQAGDVTALHSRSEIQRSEIG